MTKEEFDHQKENLLLKFRWEDAIRLCRNYAEECRQNGDMDNLAEALDGLYSELSVHGSEEEAKTVFEDLFALRKALAEHNPKEDGKAYALMLNRKAYTTDNVEEAIACQEEAINIYKELGLYDSRGFDIGMDDAFGFLGLLLLYRSCGQIANYQDDVKTGICHTETALQRALNGKDNDFLIGIYYRRLAIAYLLLEETKNACECIRKALVYFTNANDSDPDPEVYEEVTDSCRQLLEECKGRTHPNEHYRQWLN